MALGNGVVPWQTCPYCKEVGLGARKCSGCGLSYGQARIKGGEDLCLCEAERCETEDGNSWNVLHKPYKGCPPDRGVPGHS